MQYVILVKNTQRLIDWLSFLHFC